MKFGARKRKVVIIFIKNSDGKFFVHQRLRAKKIFPNRYGLGAGGHIKKGEDIESAAERELKEETGLSSPVRFVATERIMTSEETWTAHLFITKADEEIKTDETEWQWSGWMSRDKVEELNQKGKLCDDTKILYEKYVGSKVIDDKYKKQGGD